jgi:hypothetical protein
MKKKSNDAAGPLTRRRARLVGYGNFDRLQDPLLYFKTGFGAGYRKTVKSYKQTSNLDSRQPENSRVRFRPILSKEG